MRDDPACVVKLIFTSLTFAMFLQSGAVVSLTVAEATMVPGDASQSFRLFRFLLKFEVNLFFLVVKVNFII